MKKYFQTLLTAATLLTAVSCSPIDELFSGEDGEAEKVSFTISAGQIQGRSAGDGNTVDQVHYEVWHDGELVFSSITGKNGAAPVSVSSGMANVNMRLVKGVSYDIAFWAHHADGTAYDVSDGLTNIHLISKEDVYANRESYDAFFSTLKGYKVSPGVKRVELKRPFCQVNVGTTPQDWQKAEKLGVVIDQTTITVTGMANVFNALTGKVTKEGNGTSLTYKLGNVLQESFEVDGIQYRYLSMNYLLAEEERTLHDMTLDLYADQRHINTLRITNMPVQRNWRTNIIGDVLTSKENFRIVIEPGFVDDHNENIKDVEKENK